MPWRLFSNWSMPGPTSAQNHFLLAMAAGKTGDEKKARQELAEALRLDANHVPALLALARIAVSDGEKEQFAQYLATLVKLAPDAPDVLRLQALSEAQNGNAAEALVLAQRVFTLAPTTQALLELTAYQMAAGNDGDARVSLQQWIKDHPNDVAVRLALASDLERGNECAGSAGTIPCSAGTATGQYQRPEQSGLEPQARKSQKGA